MLKNVNINCTEECFIPQLQLYWKVIESSSDDKLLQITSKDADINLDVFYQNLSKSVFSEFIADILLNYLDNKDLILSFSKSVNEMEQTSEVLDILELIDGESWQNIAEYADLSYKKYPPTVEDVPGSYFYDVYGLTLLDKNLFQVGLYIRSTVLKGKKYLPLYDSENTLEMMEYIKPHITLQDVILYLKYAINFQDDIDILCHPGLEDTGDTGDIKGDLISKLNSTILAIRHPLVLDFMKLRGNLIVDVVPTNRVVRFIVDHPLEAEYLANLLKIDISKFQQYNRNKIISQIAKLFSLPLANTLEQFKGLIIFNCNHHVYDVERIFTQYHLLRAKSADLFITYSYEQILVSPTFDFLVRRLYNLSCKQ